MYLVVLFLNCYNYLNLIKYLQFRKYNREIVVILFKEFNILIHYIKATFYFTKTSTTSNVINLYL